MAVAINGNASNILQIIRSSPSNQRVLIYAVCDSSKDIFPHSRFGINATFERPLDRQNVLKLFRATRLLILNEFRRYLRIPIVLPVKLEGEGKTFEASSCELSGGGMSLSMAHASLKQGDRVTASFNLPHSKNLNMPAQVCWKKEGEKTIGVRFDETAPGRAQIRRWIDDFLEIR
ncbi:MAG TPA: PilZ domain-containing protein [Terriglobales bacterium]|nr:PilZ domain-containing protein [Terriglobales bacterium]